MAFSLPSPSSDLKVPTLRYETRRLLERGRRSSSSLSSTMLAREELRLRLATRCNTTRCEAITKIAMKSFPKVQEMFLFCVEEEMINKEEFFFCFTRHTALSTKVSLVNKNPAECKADFRVEKMDIPLLVDVLGIPSMFKSRFGTICDGTEDLCNYACIREFPRGHGLELR